MNQNTPKTKTAPVAPEAIDYEQFIQDAAAFIRLAAGFGFGAHQILETLTHDICGLARKDRCFQPRVDGYAAHEKEVISHV
jgi:hypothetical protein